MTSIIGAGTGNAELLRQHQHHKAIRARLMQGVKPVMAAIPPPAPAEDEKPVVVVPDPPMGVPLNMLLPPSWRFLLALTALRTKIPAKAIISEARTADVVAARSEAIALVHLHTQGSLPAIGKLFNRDHTTVLHTLRKLGVGKDKLVDRMPYPPPNPAGQPIVHKGAPLYAYSAAARKVRIDKAHAVIRAGLAAGRAPEEIAAQVGYLPKSVKDVARRLRAQQHEARP